MEDGTRDLSIQKDYALMEKVKLIFLFNHQNSLMMGNGIMEKCLVKVNFFIETNSYMKDNFLIL